MHTNGPVEQRTNFEDKFCIKGTIYTIIFVLVLHVIGGQMTCKFYMIAALFNFIMNGQKVIFIQCN